MQQKSDISASADPKSGEVQAMLNWLRTYAKERQNEAALSSKVLEAGATTNLTRSIEEMLSDPVGSLYKISNAVDTPMKELVNTLVQIFFKINKALLSSAYRSKTPLNKFHYSIVLKEDNMENRNKIFDFLDMYDLLGFSNKYPVYFQFVPAELASKVNYSEELKFT